MPDKAFQTDNWTLISIVTQLRTGNGYFNRYSNSYLSKPLTSNVRCSCSGTPPQTPAHLILKDAKNTPKRG